MPVKADPPLIVHANAVLAFAIAFQPLQPVPRRDKQVLQGARLADVQELAARRSLDGPKTGDLPVLEQRFRIGRTEGFDHVARVLRAA